MPLLLLKAEVNNVYVDLLWSYVSLYNTVMKIFFIASSVYILYLMKVPFRPTHDPNLDTFIVEFLILGSFAAAMVFNYAYTLLEVFLVKVSEIDLDSLVV